MGVLISHPWLALLPGAVTAALWWWSRSRLCAAGALAWCGYAVWEFFVVREGADANIRLDLLLIYPALALLTVIAIGSAVRRIGRHPK